MIDVQNTQHRHTHTAQTAEATVARAGKKRKKEKNAQQQQQQKEEISCLDTQKYTVRPLLSTATHFITYKAND